MLDYFPLDIAFDEAFFNRQAERVRLSDNIATNTHTLITSPRRYGKTSLVLKVLTEQKEIIHSRMDMMVASDEEWMKTIILEGIGQATTRIARAKKILETVKKIFQPFITIETVVLGDLSIRFHPQTAKAPHLIVLDALQRLEVLAKQTHHKIVLFFDEYQHVLAIKNALDFEASLRSFAQTAQSVVCIFSGSNRHLLQDVFNDSSRPFYNMCDHIQLDRIKTNEYFNHLFRLSKKKWKQPLSDNALHTLLEMTGCHSYFVNLLCKRLWRSTLLPTTEYVLQEWENLTSEKRYEISHDLERMTPIQRSILIQLAREPFSQPTSKDILKRLNSSASGIMNALDNLLKKDDIYKIHDGPYRVLNPLMEYILRQEAFKLVG